MQAWWESLTQILRILYCIAIPSTLVLLLQMLLAMMGGHHDAGVEFSDTSGIDDLNLDVPVYISFSCKDGEHISDGTPIKDCASALNEFSNVVAVGLNCTAPKYVEALIKILTVNTDKPVIVYPNSGEIYNPFTKTWSGGAVSFAERAATWYKAGARLIGGCCRTTPEDIRAISDFARN